MEICHFRCMALWLEYTIQFIASFNVLSIFFSYKVLKEKLLNLMLVDDLG